MVAANANSRRDLSISDGRKVEVNTPPEVSFCPVSHDKGLHGRDLSVSDGPKVEVNTPSEVPFCPVSHDKGSKGVRFPRNGTKGG